MNSIWTSAPSLRMDVPLAEVYKVCIGEGEVTKLPRATPNRAVMCRGLGLQALKDRSKPATGREEMQPRIGSLKTMNRILKDLFSYPSPPRGEPPLRWGTRVPRMMDMDETRRNARSVEARKSFCEAERCQHGNIPRVNVMPISSGGGFH